MALPLPPKVLIAHPWMGRGGSEATAMWALHALQDIAKVTFTTASPVEWGMLNATYGTSVSPEKVTLLQAPRLPGVATGTKLAFWQRAYFERFCQTLPDRYDACISAYNPIRFHQPAIQLIGDFSFDEEARLDLYPTASDQAHHRPSLLRRLYLNFGDQLAGRDDGDIPGTDDLIVANSRWTAKMMKERFGIPDSPILYPPSSSHEAEGKRERDPLGFVCMGRIMPEKEVESMIAILDRVREAGYPVTLDLAGQFGADPYSKRVARMARERAGWIRTPGFFGPREKQEVFASRTYGIHGCRVEAFGIAIAEMAGAGLLPFVPVEGGVSEIVGLDELIYSDIGDAAAKIIARLQRPESLEGMRRTLRERVTRFRPEFFSETLVRIVQDFLKRPLSPCGES